MIVFFMFMLGTTAGVVLVCVASPAFLVIATHYATKFESKAREWLEKKG